MPVILQPILDFVGKLLDVAAQLMVPVGAFLFGQAVAGKAAAEHAVELQQKQLDIAARPRADADELLQRMRDGSL
jgi:hypothetical protein